MATTSTTQRHELGPFPSLRAARTAREIIAGEVNARHDVLHDAYVYERDGVKRALFLLPDSQTGHRGDWVIVLQVPFNSGKSNG